MRRVSSALSILIFSIAVFASPPAVQVSIYGTVQKNSPLQIERFLYSQDAVQIVLLNHSRKTVASFVIVGDAVGQPRCGGAPAHTSVEMGRQLDTVPIAPHHTGITTVQKSPFSPANLILAAKDDLQSTIIHVYVAVVQVNFTDGTTWQSQDVLPQTQRVGDGQPSCTHAPELDALNRITQVGFRSTITTSKSRMPRHHSPLLSYVCTLEATEAVCPDR